MYPTGRIIQIVNRVIFLDVDGVLNSHDRFGFITTFKSPNQTSPWVVDINRVNAINHILGQTEAIKLVISSTWRKDAPKYGEPAMTLQRFCQLTGLNKSIIHDDWQTPIIDDFNRLIEVEEWLERHPEITRCVVIDDNYSDQFKSNTSMKFIHTNHATGITFKQLYTCMNFFGVRLCDDYRLTTAGGPLPFDLKCAN